MGFSLYKRKSFKILLISGILIILGVFVIFNFSQILKWWEINFEGVEAGTSDNVRGWAWGENMGWISMNCYNDFDYDYIFENCCSGGLDCPEALQGSGGSWQNDYGVTYVDTSSGNYIDDALMGYAWSDKVGWICFGKSCKCADCISCDNYNTCTNCSGCPDNIKPPHGWPFPWACVGKPTWICSNNISQTCINNDGCPGGTCIFSCSGDGDYDPNTGIDDEDFLDITAPNAPCYSTEKETLKAHWKMNGDIVEVFTDSSGHGNTLSGDNLPTSANGKINDALQFDGEDDYISATDSLSLSVTGNLVVEGWIKRGSIGSEQTIIGKWDESQVEHKKSYRLWFGADNKLNFSVADTNDVDATITQTQGLCFGYDNDGSDTCSGDSDCEQYGDGVFCRNPLITDTTKWHHVAGKYIAEIGTNAASLRLFIDGSRVRSSICIGGDNPGVPCDDNSDCPNGTCGAKWSGTPPVSLFNKNNDLYIGAKRITQGDTQEDLNTYFNGIIDNVAIWSCANVGFVSGRSAKDIWNDAKMEVSGWAKIVALGDGGWLKLQGSTETGKIWGLYLDDYDTFYTIGGYMANRYADTSMDTTGLIANWLMDEPSWTSSAGPITNGVVDSSSLNNHGTAHGAVPNTEGKFNSAGEFDGVDDYIAVADNDSLDFTAEEDFTIQYWAKPNSFSNTSTIVAKRQTGVAGYEIQITSAGYISWYISDGTINKGSSVGTDALTVNAWNHVVIVFDRDSESPTITRYLNGLATGTVDDFGSVGDLSNGLSLSIGARHLDSTAYFNGLIDNVSIYNIAKTATQILDDYNKQDPYCVGWDDYDHDYGDPPAPLAFDTLSVDNTQGCTQLMVQWEASGWAESYTYWRCSDVEESACSTCSYIEHNVLDAEEFNVQDTDVVTNTGYCYKIQAHNETGSTYNSEGPVWNRTTLCAPENVEIDDSTCGEIGVYWDVLADADGYNVYNSLSNENFGIIGHLGEAMDYTGLMAQWKMNETSWDGSNNEVRDSSGQTPANHGTAENLLSTTPNGKFSYAGDFDGINNYIDCGSSSSLEVSTATVQAWIKRASTDTRDAIIVDNESSALDKDHHLWFEINSADQLAIIFGDGVDNGDKNSTGTINDTDWHHVAVVRDDTDGTGTITFYIDGESETAQLYSLDETIVSLGNDDFWIGKSNVTGYESPFHGLIDNLAVYNVARTAEQIKFDYEAGNCGYDNCSLSGECHIQGLDTNCGYALEDESNCTNCPNYVCHIQGNPDGNCGITIAGDASICCYTDKRILPYVNYYYKTTATSEAGESPFSDCDWTGDDCPAISGDPCCPNGNTICFPPVETEEE